MDGKMRFAQEDHIRESAFRRLEIVKIFSKDRHSTRANASADEFEEIRDVKLIEVRLDVVSVQNDVRSSRLHISDSLLMG